MKREVKTFNNSQKLKRAVVAKSVDYKKGTTKMIRPVFRPLSEDGLKPCNVKFEDDNIVVLDPDDDFNSFKTGTALQKKTPLELAKVEVFQQKEDAIVLSLDTEYKEVSFVDEDGAELRRREILSYQCAVYYNNNIVRFLAFSKTEKLLSLQDLIKVIYEYLPKVGLPQYRYPIKEKVITFQSGKTITVKDYPQGVKCYVLAHNGLADFSALDDFIVFYRYLTESIDIITKEDYKFHISLDTNYYSCFNANFIGTMNHSPGPLKDLGATKGIDLPKIELDEATYQDMTTYRKEHFADFCRYGMNDSDIILKWYLMMFKDLKIPSTTTSMAAKIFSYFAFSAEDEKQRAELVRAWRGVVKEKSALTFDSYYGGVSYRFSGEKGATALADDIDRRSASCFYGGLNACMVPGFYGHTTYDFDLCGAYPTAGAVLPDVDFYYEVPFEQFAPNSQMDSLKEQMYGYNFFGFGTVDYEFPENCLFPCIPQKHAQHGLIFTRTGKNVSCTWCEVKLALRMGATVIFKDFRMFAPLKDENGKIVSHCSLGFRELIKNREITREIYDKKSLMEITAKLINNGVYGKIGQSVQAKNMRNVEYNAMEEKPPSLLTSSPHACYITALVRCILCGTMQQLVEGGFACYSVTTDGFITNATLDAVRSCDAYGLYDLFKQSREFLLTGLTDENGEPCSTEVWECKHSQKYLLNITTRMNQGFDDLRTGIVNSKDNVDAHVGFKLPPVKIDPDTGESYMVENGEPIRFTDGSYFPPGAYFTDRYLNRDKEGISFEQFTLPSLSAMVYGYTDYVGTRVPKNIKCNYDFKRKIDIDSVEDVWVEYINEPYNVTNFSTVPYEDMDEYMLAAAKLGSIKCSLLSGDDYLEVMDAMMHKEKYARKVTLKAQIDACMYHLRQTPDSFEMLNKYTELNGLQKTLWLCNNTLEKSFKAYTRYRTLYSMEDFDYKLEKGQWRNLSRADRFKREAYTELSVWLENAILYNLREELGTPQPSNKEEDNQ